MPEIPTAIDSQSSYLGPRSTVCFKHLITYIQIGKSSIQVLLWADDAAAGLCSLGISIDISANNILLEIDDKSVLDSFVKQELEHPSPRKPVNDFVVYASRLFGWPPAGEPVLCDFGSAERGDAENTRNAGPTLYRSPEVMLKMNWSYSIDIWNVGVMVCLQKSAFQTREGICLHSIDMGFVRRKNAILWTRP